MSKKALGSQMEELIELLGGEEPTHPVTSKYATAEQMERLIEAVKNGGGGSGGTTNYNQLSNKPQINGTELKGNKSLSDFGALPDDTTAEDIGGITAPASPTSGDVLTYDGDDWVAQAPTGGGTDWAEVTISTAGAVTQELAPWTIYHFTGALTALTITLAAASGLPQYHFDFDSGATAPTLTLPQSVTMPDGFTVEASKHYEVDVLNGYGAVSVW